MWRLAYRSLALSEVKTRRLKPTPMAAMPKHQGPQDCHRNYQTYGCFVLPVLAVQRPRKSFRGCNGGRKPWPECWDLRCVFHKCRAVKFREFGLLFPDYDGIKNPGGRSEK